MSAETPPLHRSEPLGAALDAWEAEDGPFTDAELEAALAALGLGRDREW